MTDFSVQKTVTGRKIDSRWRAGAHGHGTAVPGQLDPSKFTKGTHYGDDGILPSGIALSKLASGLFGPWDPTAADGAAQSVVDGYIDDELGVPIVVNGVTVAKPTVAVLKHSEIAVPYLPIVGQRAGIRTAKTSGLFIYVED